MGSAFRCSWCQCPIKKTLPDAPGPGRVGNFVFIRYAGGPLLVQLAMCDEHLAIHGSAFLPASQAAQKPLSELGEADFDWQDCNSSVLKKWAYDPSHQAFAVCLGKKSYLYFDIPPEVVDAFKNSPSQGRFWTREIKGRGKGSKPLS